MACRQGEGATHHAGCLCWEERRDAEVAAAERRGYERGIAAALNAAGECVTADHCVTAIAALLDEGQQPREEG